MLESPAGHATIGYGHLIHHGPVTEADQRRWGSITRQEGLDLLREDLVRFERAVDRLTSRELAQAEFDAVVSFAFNVGEGALEGSTLRRRVNDDDRRGAYEEFLKWNKATVNGVLTALPGLTRRRREEGAVYVAGAWWALDAIRTAG